MNENLLNYIYPDVEDKEYALKAIYKFYVSEKFPNCTYNEFINEYKNTYKFEKTEFLHIIRENEKVGVLAIKPFEWGEIFLDYIIVFPEYRNSGIGTYTINFMKSTFSQITLRTYLDEMDFYKKLNFEVSENDFDLLNNTIPMIYINKNYLNLFL